MKGVPFFEVKPPQAWYYQICPNSCTLVILLQVDLVSSDELEIFCEGFYEIVFFGISFFWKRKIRRARGTCGRKPQTLF
jgi:hypothetical protein